VFIHVLRIYFYDLERPGIFGISNCILWDAGTDLLEIHKTETFPDKPE
jgi:hypothetical protein